MSSSHVLIVPIIAAVVVACVILSLAAWVAVGKMMLIRHQDHLASHTDQAHISHERRTDDLVSELIIAIENAPATADTLLSKDVQQQIYDAHSRYQELGAHMKGIR